MKSFISALVLTLLILSTVVAQQPSVVQESKEEKEKAQKELEHKALVLLDDVLVGAQLLKLAENRALVQATAANLLWPRDEKRARTLFREAMTSISENLNSAIEKGAGRDGSLWTLMQQRQQTIQTIARRDPQLALDLLHNTRPASADKLSVWGGGDQELQLEQSIAAQIAANDPKRALQMAEESLNKGVSYAALGILNKLQQKDSEAATKFAGEIVKKLQSENFTNNREAGFAAQGLLRNLLHPEEQLQMFGPMSEEVRAKRKPLVVDEQTINDLADVVVTVIMNGPADNLMMAQSLIPELEKRVPDRAVQLRQRVAEMTKMVSPEMKKWMQYESLMRDGKPEALIEAAAKAPGDMRNGLYGAAAMKYMQAGDVEKARAVANDNLSGKERENLLASIDQQLITQALLKGKLDEAKQLASRIRSKEARASWLANFAIGAALKGDRKLAQQILSEAMTLINRQPENQEQVNALLQVAGAYAFVEPPRTFELMEPLVDQANEMLAAAALLDKFGSGHGIFKKGEMILQPGFANVNAMYAQFGRQISALARADFDHTKALADRFQRNEARLMARLLVAQGVLADQPGNMDYSGEAYLTSGVAFIENQ